MPFYEMWFLKSTKTFHHLKQLKLFEFLQTGFFFQKKSIVEIILNVIFVAFYQLDLDALQEF